MKPPWHKDNECGWDNLANFESWLERQIRDDEIKEYFANELNEKFKIDLFIIFEKLFQR